MPHQLRGQEEEHTNKKAKFDGDIDDDATTIRNEAEVQDLDEVQARIANLVARCSSRCLEGG
jgi:hypothetical protein